MRKLTKRQEQVLEGIMHGASNAEIAKELGISESMVKKHLVKLYRAKGVHSRTELVVQEGKERFVGRLFYQIQEADSVIRDIARWGGYAERRLAKLYLDKWGKHDNT